MNNTNGLGSIAAGFEGRGRSQRCRQPPESWGRRRNSVPSSLCKEPALWRPQCRYHPFQMSPLQNCKMISLHCFKPLFLWSFVLAVAGNRYLWQEERRRTGSHSSWWEWAKAADISPHSRQVSFGGWAQRGKECLVGGRGRGWTVSADISRLGRQEPQRTFWLIYQVNESSMCTEGHGDRWERKSLTLAYRCPTTQWSQTLPVLLEKRRFLSFAGYLWLPRWPRMGVRSCKLAGGRFSWLYFGWDSSFPPLFF